MFEKYFFVLYLLIDLTIELIIPMSPICVKQRLDKPFQVTITTKWFISLLQSRCNQDVSKYY